MGEDSRRRFRSLTLRQRLVAAIVLAAAVVLSLRQVELVQVRNLEQRHQEMQAAHLEARLALLRLQAFYTDGLVFRWGHGVAEGRTEPSQALAEMRTAWAEARSDWQVALNAQSFRERSATLFAPGSDRAAADAAEARMERILESGDRAALAGLLARNLEPAVARLDRQLRAAADALRLDRPVLLQRLGDEVERQKFKLNALLAAVFAGLVVAIALLFRGLDRDIAQLIAQARRLSAGDFRAPLGEVPTGELRDLAGAFVTMQEALFQHERELQTSEQLFRLSSDLLCVAGTNGYFRRVNPAFEQTLGFRTEELLTRPMLDFIHPNDIAATQAEILKLSRGVPTIDFENRYRCRDGSYKWLNWRCQPAAGGTLYAIARDVTDHKRLLRELNEQKLEAHAASQAKSTFLASMSHEIRTPLIGVLGMLEVLGRSRLNQEQRRQFEIVQQSATSLLEIVGDILDYSKIEAGKVELAPEPFAVRDLVSRVIATFSANAHAKGLQLVQDVSPGVALTYLGDPVRIRQVLANFVGNAVKFTERGSVRLMARVTEEPAGAQRVTFSVADTGVGIAKEQQARLFQPFTQSDAGTTRRYGGTGLGLVICRRLAELMGGTVRAESELGRGTIMHLDLLLPVASAAVAAIVPREEPVRTRKKPSREQAVREGSLLLLAEDHPINRKVLTDQLDLAGFLADTADDGRAALEKFCGGAYGLMLTDLHMPGLDGFQLTAAIREFEARHGLRRTPIIALSANVLRADVERTLASGMDDYLPKPVTVRQLTEKLCRWLPNLDWAEPPAGLPVGGRSRRSAVIDEAVLLECVAGDAGRVQELLRSFCQSSGQDLANLEAAWRGDQIAVGPVAHRIKGAALMVGAQEVALVAARIERSTRHPHSTDLAPLVERLRQAVARVEEYLREEAARA